MLDKEVFNSEVKKLMIEFSDKGFSMQKEKAEQWYDFVKENSNKSFAEGVNRVLMTCNKAPTMADIIRCIEESKSNNRYSEF